MSLFIEEILPYLRGVELGSGKSACVKIWADGSGNFDVGIGLESDEIGKLFNSIEELENRIIGANNAESIKAEEESQ